MWQQLNDPNDFDHGMIVGARQGGLSISETAISWDFHAQQFAENGANKFSRSISQSISEHKMLKTSKWIGYSSRRPIILKNKSNKHLIKCSLSAHEGDDLITALGFTFEDGTRYECLRFEPSPSVTYKNRKTLTPLHFKGPNFAFAFFSPRRQRPGGLRFRKPSISPGLYR